MAHKLLGDWHSYIAVEKGSPTKTEFEADDTITIDSVDVLTGEVRGRHRRQSGDLNLTGTVVNVGNSFAVFLEREPVGTKIRRYEGSLVAEDPQAGTLIIVGMKTEPSEIRAGERAPVAAATQDNGIWVSTQP